MEETNNLRQSSVSSLQVDDDPSDERCLKSSLAESGETEIAESEEKDDGDDDSSSSSSSSCHHPQPHQHGRRVSFASPGRPHGHSILSTPNVGIPALNEISLATS